MHKKEEKSKMGWDATRMKIAIQIKILRDGSFTNSDIIDAAKADLVDELVKE